MWIRFLWQVGRLGLHLVPTHPDRVAGIFAVNGVPGNTLGTSLKPLHLPGPVAKAVMVGFAHAGRVTGRYISSITTGLPVTATTANLLRWARVVDRNSDPHVVRETVQEMLSTDPDWYANLLMGNFHLGSPPAALLITAHWREGDPPVDVDGDARPTRDDTQEPAGADRPD